MGILDCLVPEDCVVICEIDSGRFSNFLGNLKKHAPD